ncbi:MAG TPA: aromatic aminobenezylarsenical efflux permease ArsG family transporter [Candidatus Hydrogenedens sp.]|nr:aromatic aminobenezylarsenical efflux permease ArsG family transporter [Candidatus Hydrogenedens sp.]HOK09718.1 aromatic aminobenezylarsenical efflux permease ArsG family transporter [Candidatus Hydrogenedens sp.]HOL19307.1 aromatic aminobenezylarsenical efflux permease ArsG family transporter [Candidatus Hydrogenedens sp.]HPP59260.1 aromatic aminobenezylarsenical efflux permease ArsG family transporter [Candidatus Hydrogenedens sp.]
MQFLLALSSAVYLGLLTSISPCPLATNIVAISYISKKITHPGFVLLNGFVYSIGRTIAYIILSFILVKSLLDMPFLSHFLQKYMNKVIGPLLIIVGMFLLDLIKINLNISFKMENFNKKVEEWGLLGAFLLGLLFALSFCPTSAALFFGGLIPLATKTGSDFTVPFFYGISTGIPVIIFAFLISFSTSKVSKAYNFLSSAELWARRITGIIFILVGIYLTLINIFKISLS